MRSGCHHLVCSSWRRVRRDLTAAFNILTREISQYPQRGKYQSLHLRKQYEAKSGKIYVGCWEKVFFPKRVVEHWNRLPQKTTIGHSTNPVRVQETFGQHTQARGVTLGPVQGQVLDFDDPSESLPPQHIL